MDTSAYEAWSDALEECIVRKKRGKREKIFRDCLATVAKSGQENYFLPEYGFTLGQLAFYTFVQAKKYRKEGE